MKKYCIYLLPCIYVLLNINSAKAQNDPTPSTPFKTWSVGVTAGFLAPFSPLGGQEEFGDVVPKLGYGLSVKKQISTHFSIQSDLFKGNMKAYMPNFAKKFYFESELEYALNLSAVVNLFNLSLFKRQNSMLLYALGGGGIARYTSKTVSSSNAYNIVEVKKNKSEVNMSIPLGAGAKFRLTEGLNLNLGWTVNFLNADNLDNYPVDKDNDRFSYAYTGLDFVLGKGEQLAYFSPVAATYDEVLASKKLVRALQADLAEQKKEIANLNLIVAGLLKDSDSDGVADKLDKCAGTVAGTIVDGAGCPLKMPAPVTIDEHKVVTDAINNLEFAFGKASINPASYPTLDKLAILIIEKNFTLKIGGHADDKGSDKSNMRLSKKRAEAVKSYLVSKGANTSRIEAVGYGENQPIATNVDSKGRQQNRRVEFTLY